MLAAALGVMAWTLADSELTHELEIQIGVFCVGLFLACMFCHGELVRLQARAALPHALLPDDLARRRDRLGARRDRRAARAAGVLRARGRPRRLRRCCCSGRCAATARRLRRARPSRRCSRRSAARSGASASSTTRTIVVHAQFLRRAARAGVEPATTQPPPVS